MTIEPGIPRKLGIRPGTRVWLVNAPAGAGLVDLVHLFCATRADLDAHGPAAIAPYRAGGYLWVSYPKGGAKAGTDLDRDVDWGALPAAGFRPVTQVAIDARWSALRFRRIEEVGR